MTTPNSNFNLVAQAEIFFDSGAPYAAMPTWIEPAQAGEILRKYNYEKQRPLDRAHAEMLGLCMANGQFKKFTNIDFAVLDGEPILVNGQHTCWAIAKGSTAVPLAIQFHRVDDTAQLETLYSQYDNGRRRTLRDNMGAIGEELDMKSREFNQLGSAVRFLNHGFRHSNARDTANMLREAQDAEFIKSLMRNYASEGRMYFDAIGKAPGANSGLFFRHAVVAVGLVTFRFQPIAATEFWSAAALDDGLRVGDPCKSLINWLRLNSVNRTKELQHRAAIACWNAHFAGRTLNRIYPATDASLRMAGTPLDLGGDDLKSLRDDPQIGGPSTGLAMRLQRPQIGANSGSVAMHI